MIKIKTLINIRVNLSQHKTIYYKSTANIILSYSMAKSKKTFSLKSGARQGCPISSLLFAIILEVLAIAIRQEKEIKTYPNWKERNCHCLQII